jgi:hypothetical protein
MGPNLTEVVRLRPGVSHRDISDGVKPKHLLEPDPAPEPKAQPKKEARSVRSVVRYVRSMNINNDESSETFIAAVLLLGALYVGTNPKHLRRWSNYPLDTIETVTHNLRKNGIWTPDGHLAYFSSNDPQIILVELCLLAMAGAGTVRCSEAEATRRAQEDAGQLPLLDGTQNQG